jgi:thiamine biosynthesis lipoprotein
MPIGIVVADDIPSGMVDEVYAWFRHVDRIFSPYRHDSEISRIARGALRPEAASVVVREVLARCDDLHARTAGFFDPLAAGRLDVSGFVKGWAVDRAAELLTEAGASQFAVNAGGDAVGRGSSPWRVGIQHPFESHLLAGVVELRDRTIATSGNYERGAHIIDPHSGALPKGVLSVTVVGPELGTADAYATAAFAMGPSAAEWIASIVGYEGMVILETERVLCTPGFLAICPGGSPAASLDQTLATMNVRLRGPVTSNRRMTVAVRG